MTSLSIAITGAGSGLGLGAAQGLARAGHRVLAAVQFDSQAAEIEALRIPGLRAERIDLLERRCAGGWRSTTSTC